MEEIKINKNHYYYNVAIFYGNGLSSKEKNFTTLKEALKCYSNFKKEVKEKIKNNYTSFKYDCKGCGRDSLVEIEILKVKVDDDGDEVFNTGIKYFRFDFKNKK